MKDLFQREIGEFGGAFTADMTRVTFPALAGGSEGSETGLLMQNLQISYTQNVQRLYELGSNKTYYTGGRANGTAAAARVIGPAIVTAEFYRTYGDVCNAGTNTLQISLGVGCSGGTTTQGPRLVLVMNHVIIVAANWAVTAADMIINEQVNMMFAALQYQD